jgi:hypothetical protein
MAPELVPVGEAQEDQECSHSRVKMRDRYQMEIEYPALLLECLCRSTSDKVSHGATEARSGERKLADWPRLNVHILPGFTGGIAGRSLFTISGANSPLAFAGRGVRALAAGAIAHR